jgi:YfaZ precursor
MQLRVTIAAALVALGYSAGANADSIGITLNNDVIAADYGTNLRTADLTFGGLYNRDNKGRYADVGLLAHGESMTGGRTEIGVGGRIYGAHADDKDLVSLALGGQVRWFPTSAPIAIGGYAFYGPSILTAVDGKNFWDISARVEWEIVQHTASVFVGYRKTHAKFDNGQSNDIDKTPFVGMQMRF